ncbi:MMPL family transporter [Mycolicibacterium mengxianglii]|uniref:MMPL family transporter n=1 Tax=Mycolicibacterium mengxianglii TaxID=2736649 RepID=UPI0018D124EC|nr:MMPL family transporter [Mycolicibacterium mengxianglii]
MLGRITLLAIAAPRRVLAVAAVLMIAAAVFGVPVAQTLSAGGFQDPSAESSRATSLLTEKFKQPAVQLTITVTAPEGVRSPGARAAGLAIVNFLEAAPDTVTVISPWTAPPQAASDLISIDGTTGLIVAGISGGEQEAPQRAEALAEKLSETVLPEHRDVTVLVGGSAMVFAQINSQTQRDLLVMEAIALPVSFVVLIWVFGGLVAAVLPLAVGGMAIVGSLAALRLTAMVTDVSIFALNLSTALGLALAIDYTLLIVSRYRDEIGGGAPPRDALATTMATAGRTVVFSAVTVALSMAAMVLFPMYFLKSFAYAGIATVVLCAVTALVVTPAAIVVLGPRLAPAARHRSQPPPTPAQELFWYRWTKAVMRRPVLIGVAVTAVLVLLGVPFLGINWGFPDDRVLPTSASAHQVGDQLRDDFIDDAATAVTIVVPDAEGLAPAAISGYAASLSQVADVVAVNATTGAFVDGAKVGPPVPGTAADTKGSTFLTVGTTAPLYSEASEAQLDGLRAVPTPDGRAVEFTGMAQVNRDSVAAITSRLPTVLAVIAAVTFVLLFLLTGSVVLPIKALVLNVLSLTAAFGALVWIFQDGHLGAFGTTATGTLIANMPVLLFCIAFGLSMDYEVFLMSRIREFWLASPRADSDNDESVALGLARTGRVVTAAALVMSISFAALIAAQVAFMRMFGVGLTLAVLVDATLVRMVLVPAFMHILGRWNWWAPAPLTRLHQRLDIGERVR